MLSSRLTQATVDQIGLTPLDIRAIGSQKDFSPLLLVTSPYISGRLSFALLNELLEVSEIPPSNCSRQAWRMACWHCSKYATKELRKLLGSCQVLDDEVQQCLDRLSNQATLAVLNELCKKGLYGESSQFQMLIDRLIKPKSIGLMFEYLNQDPEACNFVSYDQAFLNRFDRGKGYAFPDVASFVCSTCTLPTTPTKQSPSFYPDSFRAEISLKFSDWPSYLTPAMFDGFRLLVESSYGFLQLSILDLNKAHGTIINITLNERTWYHVKWTGLENVAPSILISRNALEGMTWRSLASQSIEHCDDLF